MNTTLMTTTARPAEFDVRLMAYMPMIRKIVRRYCHKNEREETAQDVVLLCLEKWDQFREEGSFNQWIRYKILEVSSRRKMKDKGRALTISDGGVALDKRHTLPNQEHVIDLQRVRDRLEGSREGRIVVRRAEGENMAEIGRDMNLSKERVRQLHVRGAGLIERLAA